ncbi:cystatin 11 [Rhinolophus ferrumequinum]|uniref:Cystatin 11 n=1 Tax=Rhinolophus ferrumequinum TaxID=59479 RepID=A0A7J7S766_RHIFE|nr:cystatin 11 [Rhinolophus ferrumequinum]
MARPWQVPQILLVILVALVALTYQARRKTFISVQEVPASETYVIATMQFVTNEFNKESDDKYSFRIVRVLKVKKLQIECFYSVFVVPWFEKYKILNKNCTNG